MCVRVYMCVCVCVCVYHTCHQDEVLPDGAKGQLLECIQLYHKTALAEPEIHVRIRYDLSVSYSDTCIQLYHMNPLAEPEIHVRLWFSLWFV